MITIKKTKEYIEQDKQNWSLYLMNFVDDFRYYKNKESIQEGILFSDEKIDPLLASTVEYLCDEVKLDYPEWTSKIPACVHPYFVSGVENLKALSLAQSPLVFRIRKIFVLENFLERC